LDTLEYELICSDLPGTRMVQSPVSGKREETKVRSRLYNCVRWPLEGKPGKSLNLFRLMRTAGGALHPEYSVLR
jgi:hypothetical protein